MASLAILCWRLRPTTCAMVLGVSALVIMLAVVHIWRSAVGDRRGSALLVE